MIIIIIIIVSEGTTRVSVVSCGSRHPAAIGDLELCQSSLT